MEELKINSSYDTKRKQFHIKTNKRVSITVDKEIMSTITVWVAKAGSIVTKIWASMATHRV